MAVFPRAAIIYRQTGWPVVIRFTQALIATPILAPGPRRLLLGPQLLDPEGLRTRLGADALVGVLLFESIRGDWTDQFDQYCRWPQLPASIKRQLLPIAP
jgi:hypothetical protein